MSFLQLFAGYFLQGQNRNVRHSIIGVGFIKNMQRQNLFMAEGQRKLKYISEKCQINQSFQ
jgi:hypothetical protein